MAWFSSRALEIALRWKNIMASALATKQHPLIFNRGDIVNCLVGSPIHHSSERVRHLGDRPSVRSHRPIPHYCEWGTERKPPRGASLTFPVKASDNSRWPAQIQARSRHSFFLCRRDRSEAWE